MAPAKRSFGLFGGGANTGLPSGYLAAEWLESTGTQVIIDESVTLNQGSSWKLKTRKTSSKSIECVFDATAGASNRFGLISYNGSWRFDYATSMQKTKSNTQGIDFELELTEDLRCLVNGTTVHTFTRADFLSENRFALFAFKDASSVYVGRIYYINLSSVTGKRAYVPTLDSNGVPCMYDKVNKKPFYNSGTGSFIVGMTLSQARKLGKLPAGGGTLTVSLPWEAGVDAKVQDALAKAAAHGWTVVVQYREPEAATENIAVDFLENSYNSYCDIELTSTEETGFSFKVWQNNTGYTVLSGNMINATDTLTVYSLISYNSCIGFNIRRNYYPKKEGGYVASGTEVNSSTGYVVQNDFLEGELNWLNSGRFEFKNAKFELARELPASVPTYSGPIYLGTQGVKKLNGYRGRIYNFSVSRGGDVVRNCEPTIDTAGGPCFRDSVSGKVFPNIGSAAYIVGFESTEKAALGLAKLPVVEAGELTVSLPAAAQEEATRVPAAIEVARQRGWTIITQYRD